MTVYQFQLAPYSLNENTHSFHDLTKCCQLWNRRDKKKLKK